MLLIPVTARAFSLFCKNPKASLCSIGEIPNQESLHQSELIWVGTAQATIKEEVKQGKRQILSPKITDDYVIIFGNCIEKWLEASYNSKQIMLLPNEHQFTKLFGHPIASNFEINCKSIVINKCTKSKTHSSK